MNGQVYVLLNGPVALTSLLTTCFFCSCLLAPKPGQEEGMKQPLLLLLWSVVGWNGCVQLTILLSVCLTFSEEYMAQEFFLGRWFLLKFSILLSLSPTAWLSVFYHVRIVPAQHAFFTWMKRNIKAVVYWGLVVDRVLILSDSVIGVMQLVSENDKGSRGQNGSSFPPPFNGSQAGQAIDMEAVVFVSSWIEMSYFILCLAVMALSSGATVLYLWRHMKRMQATSSSSFSSPQLQSQWRVTVASLVQGGLYVFCTVWILLDCFLLLFPDLDTENHILCTIISLFSLGTVINLGFGQALFRQRASDLWDRAAKIPQLCGFNRA
ncbi:taste receptor type 2 member 40-like [Conger conger]|uniref:taste receptor type 2 member 40-like n=1 Tax=Conger conger TaxID=82655 RepID=UPI002A5A7A49|nr:taste receptor type 2 member 40-like [Conger conger]